MRLQMKNRRFIFLIPIIALFAIGIFLKSGKTASSATACTPSDTTGLIDPSAKLAYIDGKQISIPEELAQVPSRKAVLGVASPSERWIEVDLSEQKLKAWDGNALYLETLISTGLPWFPTPQGEFRVWMKLRATRMEGGEGRYYYNLPNVPYVMFFENEEVPGWRGYGLHGTYWHNDFGTVHSHGCVNLPTARAQELYEWVTPILPEGKSMVRSSADNPGTRIVIHE